MENTIRTAYFAGLIDGEGHMALAKKRSSHRPLIQIDMTCLDTLTAVHAFFGVGTIRPKSASKNPNHKRQWTWRAYYYDALLVIRQIRPYLITKARDADMVLAYKPGPRTGRPKKGAAAS